MENIDDFSEQLAKYEQERYERLAEIRRNEELGMYDEIATTPTEEEFARCPRCHSTQLNANQNGYGLGKGVAGGLLLGPVGLLGGFIGSKKIVITCLKCGFQWKL